MVVGIAIAFGLYLQGVSMIDPLKGRHSCSAWMVSAVSYPCSGLGTRFTLPDFLGFAPILGAVFVLTLHTVDSSLHTAEIPLHMAD